jgi:hypothetical protein
VILGNVFSFLSRAKRGFFLGRHSFHALLQEFRNVNHLAVLRRRRFVDHDFLTFALFLEQAEHADPVLVRVSFIFGNSNEAVKRPHIIDGKLVVSRIDDESPKRFIAWCCNHCCD